MKRTRKKRTSSGARKSRVERYSIKCIGSMNRRGRAIAKHDEANFLRRQSGSRWPTEDTMIKAFEMIKVRPGRGPSVKKGQRGIRPAKVGFTLLDMVIDKSRSLETLLTAASLKLKKVRRYPGYVLIKTYNLKSRPIQII